MNTEQQQSHLTSDSGGDASKTALPGLVTRLRNGGQPDLADMADALVEALACAKNILYLLTPEVSALGMRSYLIHEKIAAALAKAGVTP